MNIIQGIILGNRYILLEKIGEGGMALVYKAKCQLLNRFVAVKILRPEFTSDEEFVNKFKRESLAAASLSHPNIVGIFDVGEEEGIYYIVMEYVSGKTLKEYIKENSKISYREALNITTQIAYALEHAHKNGVVHRDIKPHNILVTEEKIIKVTDFGIARAASSATMANTGSVMGSVHYFSPEQARGGYTDHRTDIYSLGVVIYEMLTGSLPYDAESPVTVALKHIQEEFIEPTVVNSTIPIAVNDIVMRTMEKDMTKRYQTIKELLEDIEIARNNPYEEIIHKQFTSDLTQIIPIEDIDIKINQKDNLSRRKKIIKRVMILASTAVVLFTLGYLLTYWYNNYFLVKDVIIPNIVGMKEDDGRKLMEESRLVFGTVLKQDSDKPMGEIIKTDPEIGTTVKEKFSVVIYESAGLAKVNVPDLSNVNMDAAESLLKNAKLIEGTVDHSYSDTVQKGLIISQKPTENEQVTEGSSVNLVISDGKETKIVEVPEVIGKSLSEARRILSDADLQAGDIKYTSDDNFEDGVVIEQSIKEGTQLAENEVIDLTINKLDTNENTQVNPTTTNSGINTNPNPDPSPDPSIDPSPNPSPDLNSNP
jgi:eukaryotic-like serine/threonine-protein kinase